MASQPPVPVDGNTKIWGLFVAKMDFRPANNFGIALANAGDRWSIVGKSIARLTDSGKLVGPGINTGFE